MSSAQSWERRISRLARHTPQDPETLTALEQTRIEEEAGDLALARVRGQLPFGAPGCTEDVEHRALVLWVQQEGLKVWPELQWLHHSPNEAAYRGQSGKGVAAGIPDFQLFVRVGRCVGLALELKGPGGYVRAEQRRWLAHLAGQGWYVGTPFGFEAARDLITVYLREAL